MSKIPSVQGRRKQRLAQATPIGRLGPGMEESDSDEFELDEDERPVAGPKNEPLIAKISDNDPETRQWALGSLSRLVVEDQTVFQKVVGKRETLISIVRSLFDTVMEVRIAACGLLRNLTSVGNLEISDRIVSANCLTCLVTIIQGYFTQLQQIQSRPIQTMEAEVDEVADRTNENEADTEKLNQLVSNAIILFTNLCEFSMPALEFVVSQRLLPMILAFLKPNAAPNLLKACAADFLNIVTEDYEPIHKQLDVEFHNAIKMSVANQHNPLHLRAVLCSVLCNICPMNDPNLLKIILITISNCLDFDPTVILLKILENPDIIHSDTLDFQEWTENTRAQIISLEVLTNILATDEDANSVALPKGLAEMVTQSGVCNKVLPLCRFLAEPLLKLKKLDYLQDVFSNFPVLQYTAFSCLNNIVLGMPIECLGDAAHLYNGLWMWCGEAFSSERVVGDDIKPLTVSCIRSLVQKINITPEAWHVEAIFKLAAHGIDSVRVHALSILARNALSPIGPQISFELGSLLIRSLSDKSGWVIAEAMDVIFAVFDDRFDDVIEKIGMLQKNQRI